jgi:hypothetical protein
MKLRKVHVRKQQRKQAAQAARRAKSVLAKKK